MRCLFEGGAYLKGSYHKDKTFWLYNLIYFMSIFFMAFFTRTEWKSVEIYSLWTEKYCYWWKWIPIAGLEPHCSDYSVFLSSYLILSGAYSSKYGTLLKKSNGRNGFDTLVNDIHEQNGWHAFVMRWFSRRRFSISRFQMYDKRHKWK